MSRRPSIQDRLYQTEAVRRIFEEFEGATASTLCVLPTGTGKTVVAGLCCQKTRDNRVRTGKSLFIAHRQTLIRQAVRTLRRMGLSTTVEMGMEKAERTPTDVVVATVQTLGGDRLKSWAPDHFDFIVTDECHRARAQSHQRVYSHFQNYRHLGITATEGRGDGKNLGAVYQSTAFRYTLKDAIRDGWLVPLVPTTLRTNVDLSDINTTLGDNRGLNAGDLGQRIGPWIQELCLAIRSESGDRQTIVFTPDVGSATAVAQVLTNLGVSAKWVAGNSGRWPMKRKESREILDEFERLEFQALVNCDLLEEGYDCPPIACVVNLRPTFSRFRYAQRVGRGTRTCPEIGKTDLLVLDFDWNAPHLARDLCSPVDLYDDREEAAEPEVLQEARRLAKADPTRDLATILDEAARSVRGRPRLDIRLSGKTRAEYTKWTRDPSGVGRVIGVKLKKSWDFGKPGRDNWSTEAQIAFLGRRGVQDAAKLSRWGATKLISAIKKRETQNLAAVGQVAELLEMGVAETVARSVSLPVASEMLNTLQKVPPLKQKRMFQ